MSCLQCQSIYDNEIQRYSFEFRNRHIKIGFNLSVFPTSLFRSYGIGLFSQFFQQTVVANFATTDSLFFLLVVVRIINSLHKQFTVSNLVGKGLF